MRKQHLAIGIYKIVRSIVKLLIVRRKYSLFQRKIGCMTYYDDVINRTSINLGQKTSYQTKNSCAKAFGNRSRNKN